MATVQEKKTSDEVIREVHCIKDQLAKTFDYDIQRIVEAAREKQRLEGRLIYRPPTTK